jgi:hypothetical protein
MRLAGGLLFICMYLIVAIACDLHCSTSALIGGTTT